VTRNASPEAFFVMNTGKKRSIGMSIGINNTDLATLRAAMMGPLQSRNTWRVATTDAMVVAEFNNKFQGVLGALNLLLAQGTEHSALFPAPLRGLLFRGMLVDFSASRIPEFVDQYINMVGITPEKSAVAALRDAMNKPHSGKNKHRLLPDDQYQKAQRALTAWLNNEPLTRLHTAGKKSEIPDDFPLPTAVADWLQYMNSGKQ
jgi:hypothetical protein